MILLSPVTVLLQRLQYELILARWQLGKELQNEKMIGLLAICTPLPIYGKWNLRPKIIQFFLNLAMEVKKVVGFDIFFLGAMPLFSGHSFFYSKQPKMYLPLKFYSKT